MQFWILLTLLAAVLLLWLSARQRRQLGLPSGQVLYKDLGSELHLEAPLYAEDLDLTGRPDYLLRSAEGLVPVEVKSGRSPREPYEAHIYQVAAYCALVERAFGERPAYGLIRYPDRKFKVHYTPELESDLLRLLDQMRADLGEAELDRSHEHVARCRTCGYLDLCEQAL